MSLKCYSHSAVTMLWISQWLICLCRGLKVVSRCLGYVSEWSVWNRCQMMRAWQRRSVRCHEGESPQGRATAASLAAADIFGTISPLVKSLLVLGTRGVQPALRHRNNDSVTRTHAYALHFRNGQLQRTDPRASRTIASIPINNWTERPGRRLWIPLALFSG